jgi:hypothetical protein
MWGLREGRSERTSPLRAQCANMVAAGAGPSRCTLDGSAPTFRNVGGPGLRGRPMRQLRWFRNGGSDCPHPTGQRRVPVVVPRGPGDALRTTLKWQRRDQVCPTHCPVAPSCRCPSADSPPVMFPGHGPSCGAGYETIPVRLNGPVEGVSRFPLAGLRVAHPSSHGRSGIPCEWPRD